MRLPIKLRGKIDDDRAYIFNSWLESYRSMEGWVSNTVYYWHQHKLIEHLWDDPYVTWLVAVKDDDPNMIYGWLCGEQTDAGFVIHYVMVKQAWRRMGIAKSMVCALQGNLDTDVSKLSTSVVTHLTTTARSILRGKYANLAVYNPYHKYYNLPEKWHLD